MLGFAQYMPEERKLLSQDAVSESYEYFLVAAIYSYFVEM